jgi:hypothetical protein
MFSEAKSSQSDRNPAENHGLSSLEGLSEKARPEEVE